MRPAAACPACATPGATTLLERTFRPPAAQRYGDCRTYLERRLFLLFRAMLPGVERAAFRLRHCAVCDLLFLDPRFTEREIEAKYAALTAYSGTALEYARRPARHAGKRAERIAALMMPRLAPAERRSRRVLDFGGQFGTNLEGFTAPVWERLLADTERVCVLPDVRHVGPGLDAVESGSCDVVLATHVIEHLAEPLATVRALAARLTPGGLLFVEVPLGAFREAWHFREPVTHVNFFSEASLAALLARAGLAVESIERRFQWVTTGAEWCLNAVARRGAAAPSAQGTRPYPTAVMTRRRLSLYGAPLLERLRASTPLARLLPPPV